VAADCTMMNARNIQNTGKKEKWCMRTGKGNWKRKNLIRITMEKHRKHHQQSQEKDRGGMEMYIDAFFDGMAVMLMAELITGFLCSFLFRKRGIR
jgi:hypothetical protein